MMDINDELEFINNGYSFSVGFNLPNNSDENIGRLFSINQKISNIIPSDEKKMFFAGSRPDLSGIEFFIKSTSSIAPKELIPHSLYTLAVNLRNEIEQGTFVPIVIIDKATIYKFKNCTPNQRYWIDHKTRDHRFLLDKSKVLAGFLGFYAESSVFKEIAPTFKSFSQISTDNKIYHLCKLDLSN